MTPKLNFASDNSAGVHPAVLAKLQQVNAGYAMAYGLDPWTREALDLLSRQFHEAAEAYLLWSGTAANVLGLKAVLRPHEAVLCAPTAHLYEDETGAPEQLVGCKLLPVAHTHGKITPEALEPHVARKGDIHRVAPRVVSVTQVTEYGTVYTPEELRAIGSFCRKHNLLFHLDGARLANAAASLGVTFRELTQECGVDFLSFGGAKNGLMGAEALVFLREDLAPHFLYLQKQGMQLTSKMRYLAAQFIAYFEDDLWQKNAAHANAMARRLADGLKGLQPVQLARPQQANAVFVTLPAALRNHLQQYADFHLWDEHTTECRWMCSWQTTPREVDRFLEHIHEAVAAQMQN